MASVNKWIGIGYLGKEPELRYAQSGDAICNISIACTDSYKDKVTGEKKEITEWVRVVFYRKLAEIAGQYLKKGSQVYIEGSLKTRKWADKEGQERYTTEIIANTMQMLGSRQGAGEAHEREAAPAPAAAGGGRKPAASNFGDMDDDIPF